MKYFLFFIFFFAGIIKSAERSESLLRKALGHKKIQPPRDTDQDKLTKDLCHQLVTTAFLPWNDLPSFPLRFINAHVELSDPLLRLEYSFALTSDWFSDCLGPEVVTRINQHYDHNDTIFAVTQLALQLFTLRSGLKYFVVNGGDPRHLYESISFISPLTEKEKALASCSLTPTSLEYDMIAILCCLYDYFNFPKEFSSQTDFHLQAERLHMIILDEIKIHSKDAQHSCAHRIYNIFGDVNQLLLAPDSLPPFAFKHIHSH